MLGRALWTYHILQFPENASSWLYCALELSLEFWALSSFQNGILLFKENGYRALSLAQMLVFILLASFCGCIHWTLEEILQLTYYFLRFMNWASCLCCCSKTGMTARWSGDCGMFYSQSSALFTHVSIIYMTQIYSWIIFHWMWLLLVFQHHI